MGRDDFLHVDLAKGRKRKTVVGDVLHGESDLWAPWSLSPDRRASSSSPMSTSRQNKNVVITLEDRPQRRRQPQCSAPGAAGRPNEVGDGYASTSRTEFSPGRSASDQAMSASDQAMSA